ncbi:hypothetical protein [Microcoleus sp. FACHB-672]|uniref:hypothetical protein n=1 Tax=Microcoleus sp. FACHB-672 TaxID=2692825 RepID=UPI0016834A27|nr:hypothetical protein [Microcoleus sp. FACHB-672]MBD2043146.1 hypothetical protein [Microcoleus sp. FACHB-672]
MAQETQAKVEWLEYGDFIRFVQRREVKAVFFNYDHTQAYITFKNDRKSYTVIPRHPELVSILLQNDVNISVAKPYKLSQSNNESSSSISSTAIKVLALISLVGFLILFVGSNKKYSQFQTQALKETEATTEAIKENNRLLKEVIELQQIRSL